MDAELINSLASLGPWGVAGAIVVFLRKEIAAVLSAPKEDRAVERLLTGMNEQFIANMKKGRDKAKIAHGGQKPMGISREKVPSKSTPAA